MLDLHKTYKNLDIRAEVLISELIDSTDVFDNTILSIVPIDNFNKSLRRDINNITFHENPLKIDSYKIHVVRKSLYDSLPSGLFHDPTSKINSKNRVSKKEHILQDIKDRKQQEKEARLFFEPFDQAFNHYRLALEDEERKVLTGFPVGSRHTLFDIIWGGFGRSMTNYQKSVLFSILPMAHSIAGNTKFTALAFQTILGLETHISIVRETSVCYTSYSCNTLGNIHLSYDSILGSSSEESELIYKISIQNIPTTKIIDFLPTGKTRKVVQILCNFFLPTELSYQCTYDFANEVLELEHSTNSNINRNRLGYGITL